jgi:hypothetical protein
MTKEASETYIVETDQNRHNLIQAFLDKKSLNIDYLFDATINRGSFTIKDIADMILTMYEKKVCTRIEERKKIRNIF